MFGKGPKASADLVGMIASGMIAIQSEHDIDQAYINSLCQDFMNAVQALEDQAASIAVHGANRLVA